MTYTGGKFEYMRKALLKNVDGCSMCGISEVTQLDHLYPHSDFKSLSICRLNLVPTCGKCNNLRRKDSPENFIHPYYYHSINGKEFFEINIFSNNNHHVSWMFNINPNVLSKSEYDKMMYQTEKIQLKERLCRETNILLTSLLCDVNNIKSEAALKSALKYMYMNELSKRGMNDWHTVFYKALYESVNFTIVEAKEYTKRKMHYLNNNVNA